MADTEATLTHEPEVAGNDALLLRLRRAEGQLRGVQRMIEEDADRKQILTQIAAVKAAVDQVGLKLISEELRRCQLDGEVGCQERFEDALGSLLRYATLAR